MRHMLSVICLMLRNTSDGDLESVHTEHTMHVLIFPPYSSKVANMTILRLTGAVEGPALSAPKGVVAYAVLGPST